MNECSVQELTRPSVMWTPKKNSGVRTEEFRKFISQKYKVTLENYWDLHRWSIENISDFWKEYWDYIDVIHSCSYHEVFEENVTMIDSSAKWFKGARLNFAENVLRNRDDQVALIVIGEDKECKRITYAEVYSEACRYGSALRNLGLKKNDNVVCFMSNREEAIFAMLGTTAAGAIWSGALPLYGADAAIKRFSQINPKFLFTVDRFMYDKEEHDMLDKLEKISNALTSLEKIIIVPSRPSSSHKDISSIRNGCFLDKFLLAGLNSDGLVPDLKFEQLPFIHPIFTSYTSGTTGNPKTLVHGFGGLLCLSRDFWLQSNSSRKSTWLSVSPVGWATWYMNCSMLMHGMTVVLFDGVPFFLSPTYLYDLIDKYNITNLLLTASCVDSLEEKGYIPTEKHHLSSLEGIISGGSVVKRKNYSFIFNKVKSDVVFCACYGLTEVMGSCSVVERSLPIHIGEMSTPSLGVDINCYNDKGKPVLGERGELVITKPIPQFPLFIGIDKNEDAYKNSYFNKFSDGVFAPGDICMINPETNGILMFGRSDDTLKQRGARFGSAEIYNIVNHLPEIEDSLCVAQFNGRGDERAVLFLKMKHPYQFSDDLLQQIRNLIENELSRRHVPDIILEIKDIPHNINGKKMEMIIKKIINGMPHDTDSVINKDSLKFYYNIAELKNSW